MQKLGLIFTALLLCKSAFAEQPPIPPKKSDTLSKYSSRLNQEREAKGALKQKIQTIEDELGTTKQELINISSDIQKNESNLKTLQLRIENLENKKNDISETISNDRNSIAKLMSALIRIRRTPPESFFARNKEPYETAQSISIMRNLLPSIERHAEQLEATLKDLDAVTIDLKSRRKDLITESELLQTRRIKLSTLLSKRKNLYSKIDSDIKKHEVAIQKISLQAKNLEDLVKRIKKQEIELENKRQKENKLKRKKPSIKPSQNARLPISGIIRTSYNATDELGAKSKGLTIEGRTESLVIAPMNGTVSYTGTFKRYGNIVIIEHSDNYHSLIAGLGEITAITGTQIKAGEPVGTLPNSSLNPRPTVYYELRKNGKPVNPTQKFAGLG